jgi:hydrogenase maturation factor
VSARHDDSLPARDSDGHCITCSDEGVAMRVLAVERERSLAVCARPDGDARDREEVATDLVEPVAVGDRLLVHAGVALASLGQVSPTGANSQPTGANSQSGDGR